MDPASKQRFRSLHPLLELERRLLAFAADNPRRIPRDTLEVIRYALGLARITTLRTPSGGAIALGDELAELRRSLQGLLAPAFDGLWTPDVSRLIELRPRIYREVEETRSRLVERYAGQLDPEVLEHEIRHKSLVLVLGGGGGSGFAHLGAFALLRELDWNPSLIVGASMGSLLGLFRALEHEWDPIGTALSLPRRFDRRNIFRPHRGQTRYGFPGAFFLHLDEIARTMLDVLTGRQRVFFDELAIPLEVVVTGVRLGMKSALREGPINPKKLDTFTGFRLRGRTRTAIGMIRSLVEHPRFLRELVFGRDDDLRALSVIDAIGFSCAVPGLFCFDLGQGVPVRAVDAMDALFRRHNLWGLTDGGVVNNVPASVAWDSVTLGTIGTENAFIYALDAFAPRVNSNVMFLPLQRVAQVSASANIPYADLYRSYASPPSPVELGLGWRRARQIAERSLDDLKRERPLLELVKQPLPPFEKLRAA